MSGVNDTAVVEACGCKCRSAAMCAGYQNLSTRVCACACHGVDEPPPPVAPRDPAPTDDQYRAAARRAHGDERVAVWANVTRLDGGAFVELSAWVPDVAARREDR